MTEPTDTHVPRPDLVLLVLIIICNDDDDDEQGHVEVVLIIICNGDDEQGHVDKPACLIIRLLFGFVSNSINQNKTSTETAMMIRATLSWRSASPKVPAVRRPPVNLATVSLTRYYDDNIVDSGDDYELTPEILKMLLVCIKYNKPGFSITDQILRRQSF